MCSTVQHNILNSSEKNVCPSKNITRFVDSCICWLLRLKQKKIRSTKLTVRTWKLIVEFSFLGYPSWKLTYSTKREVGKIIDSNMPNIRGDMLIPWRVSPPLLYIHLYYCWVSRDFRDGFKLMVGKRIFLLGYPIFRVRLLLVSWYGFSNSKHEEGPSKRTGSEQ